MVQEGLGFHNAGDFCDALPCQFMIVKGNGICFYSYTSYFLAGPKE